VLFSLSKLGFLNQHSKLVALVRESIEMNRSRPLDQILQYIWSLLVADHQDILPREMESLEQYCLQNISSQNNQVILGLYSEIINALSLTRPGLLSAEMKEFYQQQKMRLNLNQSVRDIPLITKEC
jgi:hypothetical protein